MAITLTCHRCPAIAWLSCVALVLCGCPSKTPPPVAPPDSGTKSVPRRSVIGPDIPKQDGSEDFETLSRQAGDLAIIFRDNTYSPQALSGIRSLINVQDAPDYNPFRVALNFEHILSGHKDPANNFRPRHGPYHLKKHADGRSVVFERLADDSPWELASRMMVTPTAGNALDFTFTCSPRSVKKLGNHRYAVLFWANYLNPVPDIALHFRGVERAGADERWMAVEAPASDVVHRNGGSYRHRDARRLPFDADHNVPWNVSSYEWPRFTLPMFYGRTEHNMTLILMFDRTVTEEDEVRFALYRFKVNQQGRRPAWDFQYVLHRPRPGGQYGFRGRMVWKRFVSPEDCLREYREWAQSLLPWSPGK